MRTFLSKAVVDTAIAASLDALPERLLVREMSAATDVLLWSLQRSLSRASLRHIPVCAAIEKIAGITAPQCIATLAAIQPIVACCGLANRTAYLRSRRKGGTMIENRSTP